MSDSGAKLFAIEDVPDRIRDVLTTNEGSFRSVRRFWVVEAQKPAKRAGRNRKLGRCATCKF
jgi:hypothetical protein